MAQPSMESTVSLRMKQLRLLASLPVSAVLRGQVSPLHTACVVLGLDPRQASKHSTNQATPGPHFCFIFTCFEGCCGCAHMLAGAREWRAGNNLVELVFSYHAGLSRKHLCLRCPLPSSRLLFVFPFKMVGPCFAV